MDDFDAVVIGGGIGGLTSALLLAKKGVRVAVFEKEPRPGGYCCSFSADGYTFDACVDSIGGLRENEPLRIALEERLGIWKELEFIELDPVRRNVFPGMSIDIPADADRYRDSLIAIFPAERSGIVNVFSVMDKIYTTSLQTMTGVSDAKFLYDLMEISFYDLLSSYVSDAKLKAVLSSYCTYLGLPAHKASAIALSNVLMHYVKGGAFRVRGGFQKLVNALVKALVDNGGVFLANEEISGILCDRSRATGVQTKSGRKVYASQVISNIDIRTTVGMMPGHVVDELTSDKISKTKASGSFYIAYIGVKDDLRRFDLPPNLGYFGSYDLDGMLNSDSDTSFGVSFPSLLDPSVAPNGCGTIVIHRPLCYSIDRSTSLKEQVDHLHRILPGIADKIAYYSVAGPDTLQRYTGNTHGAAYGWEQEAGFLKNLSFTRNITGNFHVVGHWAGYGGGVLPSVLSACKVVDEIVK